MSSEHDESAELLEDLSMKSDAEKSGSPPPKKFQGPGDHAKAKKKGRRGKKRKQRKASGAAESENQEDSETHPDTEANRDSPTWDSDEEFDCEISAYNDVIIRPVNVPKAPENSTQFIIDDHNLCHLYMSFETPNPYRATDPPESGKEGMILEPAGTDAAYIDIDFEYDPPQDFDNSAYYDKEFENSYKSNRFDELLRLPRAELISGLRVLEARLKELSDDLVKENPSPILEQLQAELLELQEKHNVLKDSNTSLTALVAQNEKGSNVNVSVEDSQKHLTLVNNVNFDKTNVEHQSPVSGTNVGERCSQLEELLHLMGTSRKWLQDARSECDDVLRLRFPASEYPKTQLFSEQGKQWLESPMLTSVGLSHRLGKIESSPRLGEVVSSPNRSERESSPRLGGVESSPRLGNVESSPRLGSVESSPRLGGVESSPRLGGVESSPRLGGVESSPRLGGVESSPRLGSMESSPRLGSMESSPRLGGVESSPRLGGVESSPRLDGVESSPRLGGVESSPRLGGVESSPRLGRVESSPRLGGVESSPRLGGVESSPRLGGVESSPRLGEVNPGLLDAKSSCELERTILRDLPCRDHHSCEETSHSVASEEHELSAAVLV